MLADARAVMAEIFELAGEPVPDVSDEELLAAIKDGLAVKETVLPGAKSGDVALGGRVGNAVEDLLHGAMRQGVKAIEELVETALRRMLRTNVLTQRLFNEGEVQKLAEALESTVATADLMGRAIVRDRLRIERQKRGIKTEAVVYEDLPTPAKPFTPDAAIDYFKSLVPELGTDPGLLDTYRRTAFTMAVATEAKLLEKVQEAITARLQTGVGVRSIEQDIKALMDEAGVTSRNPQYSELIFRTNAMDAYNTGYQDEFTKPEVAESFPVWMYSAIPDSRVRPEHLAHNGKYYPNHVPFVVIRDSNGSNGFNCRCVNIAIWHTDWAELQSKGARVETTW